MCITGPTNELIELIENQHKSWEKMFGIEAGPLTEVHLRIFWDWIDSKEVRNVVNTAILLKQK